jgi:energy-coupling factor transporter ATP-binding protein EcfA2
MILRSLEVANFRKFRNQVRVDGFTDGLNIVVEPNETGKSTLLEALRAAFFIRYSAKTELVRSYMPIGDDVAPWVSVGFEIGGQAWNLEKQFMRAPFVRLSSADGRRENDAAEERLQELLGFERGNNRGTDPETRGPLGMLWVEQATALSVESPNRIVRDTVQGVLEAEVGVVTGGRRFDAIRESIEVAYSALRTGRTGQSRGELAAAEARVATAITARQVAENALRDYDQSLSELEVAKARLRIVERDIVDPEVAERRKRLEEDLKVGESVQLRLSAAEALHGRADEVARTAAGRIVRLDDADQRAKTSVDELDLRRSARDDAKSKLDSASNEEKRFRTELEVARAKREQCEKRLSDARQRADRFRKAAGARRARDARNSLVELEKREFVLQYEAAGLIDAKALKKLENLERAVIAARARFDAGIVKVDFELSAGILLQIDGESSDAKCIDVVTATRLTIGQAGSLVVRPPEGAGRSIEADRAAAEDELAAELRGLDLASYSAAVARSERAASAERELKALRAQIAAACPGDPTIGLAPGAFALRAFVAALNEDADPMEAPDDDLEQLEHDVSDAKRAEATATGIHEESRTALSKIEQVLATVVAELASATREEHSAVDHLRAVLTDGNRATLQSTLEQAQRDRASTFEILDAARQGAKSFDLDRIRRSIANLDRAAARATEERLELTARIASLSATVTREGTSGPAGAAAEAQEEELVAVAAYERIRREADVLEMLRAALADAAKEASRTFLAPVTKRAARYVQQLLPGSELAFDEELSLASIVRAGVDEACGDLSRGTQEQLAILTRLAFADLLLEDGAPISLILDDPLVYSDDARLEVMTDILQEASKRMQVILLTCRSKAFRHVDANRILLR